MMVWACFSGNKIGPLIPCDIGAINADRYLEILTNGVISFVNELFTPAPGSDSITVATSDSYLFMHDNAPCHTAEKVTKFLKSKRIPVMKWPAQSPDLNPIENLWTNFKDRFNARFYEEGLRSSTSKAILERCRELFVEVWSTQGQELIDKLIESMPRRVEAVIAAKGDITKY